MMEKLLSEEKTVEVAIAAEEGAMLPEYGTSGAAGADVRAFLTDPLPIAAGACVLVPTGLRVAIPPDYEIQVRPRSGLAAKNQVTVLNSPGTIDHDYRGEIKVILINHGKEIFIVEPGMRIAQLIVAPVVQAHFHLVDALEKSERGSSGFGSTGLH